jgi:hypothetical protein
MNSFNSTKRFFKLNQDLFFDAYLKYSTKNVNKLIFNDDNLYSRFVHYIQSGQTINPENLQAIFNKGLEAFKKDLSYYFA